MKKIILLVLFCVVTLSPKTGSANTVVGDNFILQDASGKTTAQLTTSGEGTPALFFYDKDGVMRISIGLYADGAPGVVLNDNKGLAGAILRLVESKGEPVVVLKENGQDRYVIRKGGPDGGTGSSFPMISVLITIVLSIMTSVVVTLIVSKKILMRSVTAQGVE